MTLHMVQMALDLPRFTRWTAAQHLLQANLDDDLGYPLHAVLRAAFDTPAPAPFALIRHPARMTLLAYSARPAIALREQAAAFAAPDVAAAIGLPTMAGKEMPARFAAGCRLGFTLRARPVVRTDRDGNRDRSRETDAFLAAIAAGEAGNPPSRGEVYCAWLTRLLAHGGAQTNHLVLDAFRLCQTLRRDSRRKLQAIRGPEASFSGVVTVADPERFSAMLARGVGRHCAFGFGMLLLRPVSPDFAGNQVGRD